jgi:hypothetical protein
LKNIAIAQNKYFEKSSLGQSELQCAIKVAEEFEKAHQRSYFNSLVKELFIPGTSILISGEKYSVHKCEKDLAAEAN